MSDFSQDRYIVETINVISRAIERIELNDGSTFRMRAKK